MNQKKIADFIGELSSKAPIPGGGSVAGLNLALAGALLQMVINLSINKKGLEEYSAPLNAYLVSVSAITGEGVELMKKDADAFAALMELYRKKEKDPEEMEKALLAAAAPGMAVIERALELAGYALQLLPISNKMVISDIDVAIANIRAAASAAYSNILINVKSISEKDLKESFHLKGRDMLAEIEQLCDEIHGEIMKFLGEKV